MHAYKTAKEERRGRARSTRRARVSRHSYEKREKPVPVLQADNKKTGRGTEILEKNRDRTLSL